MPAFHLPHGTCTSSDLDQLASALDQLRLTIEPYLLSPELARDGLSCVLNTAADRLTGALRGLGREADAERLAQNLTATLAIVNAETGSFDACAYRKTLSSTLGVIDGLLIAICLPLKDELPPDMY